MTLSRATAIVRNDLKIRSRDVAFYSIVFLTPLFLIGFYQPVARLALQAAGHADANGAEQTVPGMALTFGFFVSALVGYGFLEEHGWGTWPRVRASGITHAEILIGKVVFPLGVVVAQFSTLYAAGSVFYDLRVHRSFALLALVVLVISACIVSFGMVIAALCRTVQQVGMVGNLTIVVLGTLGGTFLPISVLPSWAQAIAPLTPTYWAMDALLALTLPGRDSNLLASLGAVCGFTALFAAAAAWRFRFDDEKLSWQ